MDRRARAHRVYLFYAGATSALFSMVFMVNTLYRIEIVGLNPLQLVLVGTALELSCFAFEVPTGIVADLFSRRASILIGLVIIGAGFLLEGLIVSFAAVIVAQVIWGLGYTFTSGADTAWIADELGADDLTELLLRATQIRQVTALLGMGVGVLIGLPSVRFPLIIAGALFLVLAGVLKVFMPETQFVPGHEDNTSLLGNAWSAFGRSAGLIRVSPVLMTAFSMSLLYGLYSEGFDRLWQAHFLSDMVFPGQWQPVVWFGLINAVAMVLSIISVQLVRKRLKSATNQGLIRPLIATNVVLTAGIIAFGLAGHFTLAIATYFASYLARKINSPIYSAWQNRAIHSSVRATVLSTLGQVEALGQIIGGPILGFIANAYSIPAAIVSAGLILAPIIPLLMVAAARAAGSTELRAERV